MNKKPFKKIFKPRLLYLFIGLFFAIALVSTQAAWNTKVTSGELVSKDLWNDMVDKLIDLEATPSSLSLEYSVTEGPGDGDCIQTLNIGSHSVCFLTHVENMDTDDSSALNDDYYCRVYKSGPDWILEAYASRQRTCLDTGVNKAVCKARCLN